MPLPIAHSAAGVASYLAFRKESAPTPPERPALLLLAVVAANAPDLDFLPGILVGRPGLLHHGISHSLLLVTAYAGVLFLLASRSFAGLPRPRLLGMLSVAALSHCLFDFLSADTSPPRGIPLFWPLSSDSFLSPFSVFTDVVRTDGSTATFFTTLFNTHNLVAVLGELFFSGALLAAVSLVWAPVPAVRLRSRLALFLLSALTFAVIRWA